MLTQYFQLVLGYSTVKAGAALLPQAAVMMVTAPLSNVFVQRWGNKIVVAGGLIVVAACLMLFLTLDATSSTLHVIVVVTAMAIGMGNVARSEPDASLFTVPPDFKIVEGPQNVIYRSNQ